MITDSLFINILWLTTVVLEAGILFALLKRGLHRHYARFTAYIVWQLVGDIFLAFVRGSHPYVYYFGYWVVTAVSVALTFVILAEIVRQMLRPLDPEQKIASALLGTIAALSIALFPVSLMGRNWRPADAITGFILVVDRDLRILVFGVGIGILILGLRLGVSQREFAVGITSGFVLSSSIHLMIATVINQPTILHRSTLVAIDLAGVTLAEVIWLAYALLSPEVMLDSPPETPPPIGTVRSGQAHA